MSVNPTHRQRAKRSRDKVAFKRDITPLLNQIITGDCRELAMQIPDNSVDLIFTDPPYHKEYIPLYAWLSKEAERVLKPGGFLLTYVGNYWKFETMHCLGQHLTYFWDYITVMGDSTIMWPRRTIARCKSILCFVKGEGQPRCNVLGLWTGGKQDKRFHKWGQDEQTARYYIDCFSASGELVWEPFVGGGTVPVVCKQMGRNFIGFEIDANTAAIARERLNTIQMPLPEMKASQMVFEEGA